MAQVLSVPQKLRKGDTVAVLATSGPCDASRLDAGVQYLQGLGLNVRVMQSCHASHGTYLAGSDAVRLQDLHTAFADPTVKGIIVARGGYGAARLLPYIDYDLLRRNPKIFVGYSDVTALHTAINQLCGFATFHGPMVTGISRESSTDTVTLKSLEDALFNARGTPPIVQPKTLVPGRARGVLTGGNLCVIASLLGTPYEIKTRGRILFLEEINEEPYRVDRLLLQLKLAGKLRDAAGIVLGDFTPETMQTLHMTISEIIVPEGVPTVYGLSCGHALPNITLMLGGEFTLG